jgi:fibronectin type 3 domain-containing protein
LAKSGIKLLTAALAMSTVLSTGALFQQQTAHAAEPYEWRPMMVRTDNELGLDKVDFPLFYNEGRMGGEGYQYIQGAAVHPDGTVLMAQDMGATRVSIDFGRTWYTPPNSGNLLQGGNAVAIDPADSNIMYAVLSSNSLVNAFSTLTTVEGIYRSTDKGQSWTLVHNIPDMPRETGYRFFKDTLAAYPTTGGTPESRVWRFAVSDVDNTIGGLYSSTGGVNWTKVSTFDHDTFGKKYTLQQHPSEADTLFLGTEKGVWRTVDGGVTWTRQWSSVINGGVHSLWIDPDNTSHMLVSVKSNDTARRGVWETVSGGSAWNRILSDINPGQLALGAKDSAGHRMLYVHNVVGQGPPRIRNLSGEWITPVLNTDNPDIWTNGSITGQLQDVFLPHPTEPEVAIVHGRAYWWRTEGTEGTVWTPSSTNFFGPQFRNFAFDANDWQKMDISVQDAGVFGTTNGSRSFWQSLITGKEEGGQWARMILQKGASGLSARSARSIVRLPDPWPENAPPPVYPEEIGRRVMTLGGSFQHFIFTQNKGQTTWNDWIGQDKSVGGDGPNRNRSFLHLQNPNIVYAGPNVSLDGGTTWTINTEAKAIHAMSYLNSDIIYSVDKPSNTDFRVMKSEDRGQTWQQIFAANWNLRDTSQSGILFTDPESDKRLYSTSSNRDVMLLTENNGVWTGKNLNLRSQFPNNANDIINFSVDSIAIDESNPRLIYALLNIGGYPNVWRGRMNEDYTACDWESISFNAPRITQSTTLNIHPITGDVILGSGNGNFVYPAPDDWQNKNPEHRPYKSALWNSLPKAIPTKNMDIAIGAADIGAASVKIHWTPVAGAAGYKVLRFSHYATIPDAFDADASATDYSFTGLEPGTKYRFQVLAKSAYGFSHASLQPYITTKSQAPASLRADSVTETSIDLKWNDSPGAQSYTVYKLDAISGQYVSVGSSVYAGYTDAGLVPGTAHTYKVAALNAEGAESEKSAALSVTTVPHVPQAAISYSTTSATAGTVVASLNPSEPVTITNNGGSSTYTFYWNGSFTFEFVDNAGNRGTATAVVNNIQSKGTAKPGQPVLTDNNGFDTGLMDGSYDVTMNLYYGQNGKVYKLYENNVLIETKVLTDNTPNAQTVTTAVYNKPNGTYRYVAELANAFGTTRSEARTVNVTQAKPGVPVLSNDNWDGDGSFKINMNMWWGMNGAAYRLYENGVLIETKTLTEATPNAQSAVTSLTNKAIGTYEYRAELVNYAGATSSEKMVVKVTK